MLNLNDICMQLQGIGHGVNPMVLNAISISIGLLMLFFGYRLFKFFIFLVGFAVGAAVASLATDNGLMIVLGGILAGFVAIALWYVGIFLVGAMFGILVVYAAGVDNSVVALVAAVLFGVLAIVINRLMITISTSWTGANMVVYTAAPMMKVDNQETLLVVTLALAVVGIVCQYLTLPKKAVAAAPAVAAEKKPAQ